MKQNLNKIQSDVLVSVVVITYNSSEYVIETLESIKTQTYKNLELIISDDCSTDDTINICNNWLKKESKRFVNGKIIASSVNTGIPSNCNRGWKAASGKWLKLIAGDDMLLPTCIESNINYIRDQKNVEALYSEAKLIDGKGIELPKGTRHYKNQSQEWKRYFMKQNAAMQLKLFSRDPIFLVSPTFFVSKNHFQAVTGFDENINTYEDITFVLKTLIAGKKIHYFSENTVAYRIHDYSISKKKSKEKEMRNLKELSYIYKKYRSPYLKGFNIYDLGCRFEAWLQNVYVLKLNLKGARFLAYLNPFKIYQKWIIKQFSN